MAWDGTTRSKSGSPWVPTASEVTVCAMLSSLTTVSWPPRSTETSWGEKPLAAPPTGITIVVETRSDVGREADARGASDGMDRAAPSSTPVAATMATLPTPVNATAEVCDRNLERASATSRTGCVV